MSRQRRGGKGRRESGGILPASALPTGGAPRRLRVERDLHDLLVGVLGGLSDPRLSALRITRVQLTDDLSFARVFVRELVVDEAELGRREESIMRGLEAAAGRVRAQVAQTLQLRRAPELRFVYDHGQDNADRVDELLAEIHAENGESERVANEAETSSEASKSTDVSPGAASES